MVKGCKITTFCDQTASINASTESEAIPTDSIPCRKTTSPKWENGHFMPKIIEPDEKRPETRTLRSSQNIADELQAVKDVEESNFRTCFVCGDGFPVSTTSDKLSVHEARSEASWYARRAGLFIAAPQLFLTTTPPRRCEIPSVDGTLNTQRFEELSLESAKRAQFAQCMRCSQRVAFAHADQHLCIEKKIKKLRTG